MKIYGYILLAVFGLAAGLALGGWLALAQEIKTVADPLNMEGGLVFVEEVEPEPEIIEPDEKQPFEGPLPTSAQLDVPFTSQAPNGIWDLPYQEACEEASLLMVHHYLDNTGLTTSTADAEIQQLVAWQNTHFGDYKDTTIEETAEIAEQYYGYKTRVIKDPTVEDIKREIANGNPVIIPAAGRDLGNPNFTPPGPWYHNLVITGYDGTTFTTNDPGTRNGEDYVYSTQTLMAAIHDWTGVKEQIGLGEKTILVVELN